MNIEETVSGLAADTLELAHQAAIGVEHAAEAAAHTVENVFVHGKAAIGGLIQTAKARAYDQLAELGAVHVAISGYEEFVAAKAHVEAAIVELARELGA